MKDIIKKSWRDVSIKEFNGLIKALNDDELQVYEKELIKVAFVLGISEEDAYNLPINEVYEIKKSMAWMDDFKLNTNIKYTKIRILNQEYSIRPDLHDFTIGQYIDFQTFFPKRETSLANVLACFIVPKGKKYGEGYDINELVEVINSNLDIMTAQELVFFFLKSYLLSIRVIIAYLKVELKVMKFLRMKNTEVIAEKIEKLEKSIMDGLPSLTTYLN